MPITEGRRRTRELRRNLKNTDVQAHQAASAHGGSSGRILVWLMKSSYGFYIQMALVLPRSLVTGGQLDAMNCIYYPQAGSMPILSLCILSPRCLVHSGKIRMSTLISYCFMTIVYCFYLILVTCNPGKTKGKSSGSKYSASRQRM